MENNIIKIGRNPQSDIVVGSEFMTVSNNHCEIENQNGVLVFYDHSTNGSYVNGELVHNGSRQINRGDHIQLSNSYVVDWSAIDQFFPPMASRQTSRFDGAPQPTGGRSTQRFDSQDLAQKYGGGQAQAPSDGSDPEATAYSGQQFDQQQQAQGHSQGQTAGSLQPGQLFHNRYLLIQCMGQGASAQVWMAEDTKANNLRVALKIFQDNSGFSSYGIKDFESEFTNVYNLKHSNLLPPSAYDIVDGQPYLVMQFCQRGSCSGLVGKAREEDVINLLHDVSAGLEYLHAHNMIHQDIKPDNILIDDNGNYMVTDFGISIHNAGDTSSGGTGGTQAYMGPERFNGVTTKACDMWALGATAVEMLTGNPPYGEMGGLLQPDGENFGELPTFLQPEVKALILGCLEKDPNKRLTAKDVHAKTAVYKEIGQWERPTNKRPIAIICGVLALLIVAAGIYFWDYNRTKVYYYKQLVDVNGVPQGIDKVSSADAKKRGSTCKLEFKGNKLRTASIVNAKGYVDPGNEVVKFYYTADGKIDYLTVYDNNGKLLYKLDYDENLRTATVRSNDEFGTEKNLPKDINSGALGKVGSGNNDETNVSRISRYLYTYDENGRVKELRYAGFQNVPASDENGLYGYRQTYDDQGRELERIYIGLDGEPKANAQGIASIRLEYNDVGDMTGIQYFNVQGEPTLNSDNVSSMEFEYDKYGNEIKISYFGINGQPVVSTGNYSAMVLNEWEDGQNVLTTFCDLDGNASPNNNGFAYCEAEYNDYGFVVKNKFYDENHDPVMYNGYAYEMVYTKDDRGNGLDEAYFDTEGEPSLDSNFVNKYVSEYDSVGNLVMGACFGKDGEPVLSSYGVHMQRADYDQYGNMISKRYYGTDSLPTLNREQFFEERNEYNRQGALIKKSYYDVDGNLTNNINLYAYVVIEYDELGNKKEVSAYDKDGKACAAQMKSLVETVNSPQQGFHKVKFEYDRESNLGTRNTYYDTDGKVIEDQHAEYDKQGRLQKTYTLDAKGNLTKNSNVVNFEYDNNNRPVREWYTDLNGKKVNRVGEGYHEIRKAYNQAGLLVEETAWSTDGKAAKDQNGIHRYSQEYDKMNRLSVKKHYDVNDNPCKGTMDAPEIRFGYDKYNQLTDRSYFDGQGKASTNAFGVQKEVTKYDSKHRMVAIENYAADGSRKATNQLYNLPIWKIEVEYDDANNVTSRAFYDVNDKKLGSINMKYNERNRQIEETYCDGEDNLTDRFIGGARGVIEYADDGVTPTKMTFYSETGRQIGVFKWNAKTSTWDQAQTTISDPSQYMKQMLRTHKSVSKPWHKKVIDTFGQGEQRVDGDIYIGTVIDDASNVLYVCFIFKGAQVDMNAAQQLYNDSGLKPSMRQELNLPSNVTLNLAILDRNYNVLEVW